MQIPIYNLFTVNDMFLFSNAHILFRPIFIFFLVVVLGSLIRAPVVLTSPATEQWEETSSHYTTCFSTISCSSSSRTDAHSGEKVSQAQIISPIIVQKSFQQEIISSNNCSERQK